MQLTDSVFQLCDPDELRRGKRPDRNNQLRFQETDLSIEMRAAVGNLRRVRNAIAAALRVFSRKAADDGAHVNPLAKFLFADVRKP